MHKVYLAGEGGGELVREGDGERFSQGKSRITLAVN